MERPKLTRLLSRKPGYILTICVCIVLIAVVLMAQYIESVGHLASATGNFSGDPVEVLAEVGVKEERDEKLYIRLRYDVQEDDGATRTINSGLYVDERVYQLLSEGQMVTIEYDSESHFNWRMPSVAVSNFEFDFTYVRWLIGGIIVSVIGLGVVSLIERL